MELFLQYLHLQVLYEKKNTKIVQISLSKAAHYPHVTQMPDLKSKHGHPDAPYWFS